MTIEEKKILAFETIENTPYLKLLGIEAVEFETGKAVLSLPMNDKLRQPYGLLHGDGFCGRQRFGSGRKSVNG